MRYSNLTSVEEWSGFELVKSPKYFHRRLVSGEKKIEKSLTSSARSLLLSLIFVLEIYIYKNDRMN